MATTSPGRGRSAASLSSRRADGFQLTQFERVRRCRARPANEQAELSQVAIGDFFHAPPDGARVVPDFQQELAEFNRQLPSRRGQVKEFLFVFDHHRMAEGRNEVLDFALQFAERFARGGHTFRGPL